MIDLSELDQNDIGATYTISQAAKKIGVPVHKIRYFLDRTDYQVVRDKMGNREFMEADLANIKKLMEVRKSSISYEAIGNFILKGNPLDTEIAAGLENETEKLTEKDVVIETEEKSISQIEQPESVKALMGTILKFQSSLDNLSDKLDKIDEISDKLDKLDKLDEIDNLAGAEDLKSLKKEVKSYLDKSQQMIVESNRQSEQRVTEMTNLLKDSMARRKQEAEANAKKGLLARIFGR